MSPSLTVDPGIREKLPNLKILIAVIRGINPDEVDREGCSAILCNAWSHAQKACSSFPNVQSHPNIAAWRIAYQSLGIPVKKYTTSIENLVKRACKEGSTPRLICPLVDLYNACSLRFLVPFGGFDMVVDGGIGSGALELRWTREGDTFHALDSDQPVPLASGEAVYVVGSTVLTRHINWKQSREALISDSTRDVVLMAEVLDCVDETVLGEMEDFLRENCQKLLKRPVCFKVMRPKDSVIEY